MIKTYRTDDLYYDGPGELDRDSVKAAFAAYRTGAWISPESMYKAAQIAHNTSTKARAILEHHGYKFQSRKMPNATNDGHYFEYRLMPRQSEELRQSIAKIESIKRTLAGYPEGHPQIPEIAAQVKRLEKLIEGKE